MIWRLLTQSVRDAKVPPEPAPTATKTEPSILSCASAATRCDVPRYPPYERGIPVVSPTEIVRGQEELIDRIFRAAGLPREEFKRIEAVVERLARYVHLLPATSTTHHRLEGGLFRMALEVGLYSLQAANGAVFPTGSVERRYAINPKWHLATLLAGMCAQLWRAASNVVVVGRHDERWMPLLMPLYEWAKCSADEVYYLRWREDADVVGAQASSAFLINQIVPSEMLQFLASDSPEVLAAMTSAIAGSDLNPSRNRIARIVAPVTTQVIEEDLKRLPANYGKASIGYHLEPHLIDAMRRLVKGGAWVPNASGGILWIGSDGTYLDWSRAASDVAGVMTRDAFVGVPKDPDTLADMLCDANVLERTAAGERYWRILLPDTGELRDGAVRFALRGLVMPQQYDFGPFESVQLRVADARVPAPQPKAAGATRSAHANHESAVLPQVEQPVEMSVEQPVEQAEAPRSPAKSRREKREPHGPRPSSTSGEAAGQQATERSTGAEVVSRGSGQADRLLSKLRPEHAALLKRVVECQRTGQLTGLVRAIETGLVVTQEELGAHALNAFEVIDEISQRDWLWRDPAKPLRKVHKIDIDGTEHLAIVIKAEIAAMMGFELNTSPRIPLPGSAGSGANL